MHKLSDNIERKYTDVITLDGFEIKTDSGFKPVVKVMQTVQYEKWILRTESLELECADTHIVFREDMTEVFVKDLIVGDKIVCKHGTETVVSVYNTYILEHMYDLEVDDDNHRFYSNDILSHNSTSTICFLLWYLLFNPNKSIALLANKGATSRMLLARVQLAYYNLPKWLQQGIVDWNKGSFSLENGSRIVAASTSSDSIRGDSFSCITGETLITVKDFLGIIRKIEIKDAAPYTEVLTNKGFKKYNGLLVTSNRKDKLKICFSDSSFLRCTLDHQVMLLDGSFVKAEDLSTNHILFGFKQIEKIEFFQSDEDVYDLINVEETASYITSGIVSHNCIVLDEMAFIPKNTYDDFYKSVYPTISSGADTKFIAVSTPNGMNHFYDAWMKAVEKKSRFVPIEVNWWDVPGRDEAWKEEQLANMSEEDFSQEYANNFVGSCHTLLRPDTLSRIDRDCLKPIQSSKQTAIFKEPIWGHKYIATVDCADTGDDASTISIIDITQYPYEQVARFKDNKISHLSFPQIIVNFATKYNMADVLVESNDVGKVILHILNYDIGYENIVSTKIGARIGLGQRTTSKTKPIGCARLKDMLESGKMIIRDADTSTELKHFVLDGHSYAAEDGYHDDLVMGLVNLAYYANTSSFRYHHDSNFTDEYRKEYEGSIMDMLTPLPMFSVDNEVDEEDLSFLRELRS
jgi:hypothetical protein